MKKKIQYALLLSLTLLLIINPQKSVMYAQNGLDLCRSVIIPSLFPFFVCSGLLIYSGFCEVLAKFLQPVMKPLFNVNGSGAAAFVLGIISGYPLGAVTACQLYEKSYLSKTEAERLLAFCNNSGPLFILGAVGISLYHNPKIGVILYISHMMAALATGILFRFYRKNDFNAPMSAVSVEDKSFPEIFSTVLANSLQNIITVCGAVVFFSVISSIVTDFLPLSADIKSALIGLMEFVTGINAISQSSFPLFQKLVLSAGVVGFAGLSVHIQVMSVVTKYNLSLMPYMVGKSIQACLAMLMIIILLRVIPSGIPVFSPALDINGGFAMNSLFMILAVVSTVFITLGGSIFALFYRHFHKKEKETS